MVCLSFGDTVFDLKLKCYCRQFSTLPMASKAANLPLNWSWQQHKLNITTWPLHFFLKPYSTDNHSRTWSPCLSHDATERENHQSWFPDLKKTVIKLLVFDFNPIVSTNNNIKNNCIVITLIFMSTVINNAQPGWLENLVLWYHAYDWECSISKGWRIAMSTQKIFDQIAAFWACQNSRCSMLEVWRL